MKHLLDQGQSSKKWLMSTEEKKEWQNMTQPINKGKIKYYEISEPF